MDALKPLGSRWLAIYVILSIQNTIWKSKRATQSFQFKMYYSSFHLFLFPIFIFSALVKTEGLTKRILRRVHTVRNRYRWLIATIAATKRAHTKNIWKWLDCDPLQMCLLTIVQTFWTETKRNKMLHRVLYFSMVFLFFFYLEPCTIKYLSFTYKYVLNHFYVRLLEYFAFIHRVCCA